MCLVYRQTSNLQSHNAETLCNGLTVEERIVTMSLIESGPGSVPYCCQALRCQKMDGAHVALHILALKTPAVSVGDGFDFDSECDTL